jgi:hypothetical protein
LFETEDQLQANIHTNVSKAHMEKYISHKSKKRVFMVFQTPLSVALWLKRPAHTVPGQGPDSNSHHVCTKHVSFATVA